MRLEDLLDRGGIPDDALEVIRQHLRRQACPADGAGAVTPLEREQLAALTAIGDLVVYYRDRSLAVTWANQAAACSLDPMGAQFVGQHCHLLWHGREAPCEGCPVLLAFETGESHEAETTVPDGRIYWLRAHPVRDVRGELLGVVESASDITERRRSEQAIAQAESLYRQAIESAAGVHPIAATTGRALTTSWAKASASYWTSPRRTSASTRSAR